MRPASPPAAHRQHAADAGLIVGARQPSVLLEPRLAAAGAAVSTRSQLQKLDANLQPCTLPRMFSAAPLYMRASAAGNIRSGFVCNRCGVALD